MNKVFNDVGSMDAVPSNFRYVHLDEDIEIILKADRKYHSITIHAKVDVDLKRYDIYPNKKALYENFGIEVEEWFVSSDSTIIHIEGGYCIDELFLYDKYLNTNRLSNIYDQFNWHKFKLLIPKDSISHIAVAKPISKSNILDIHFHNKDNESHLIDIVKSNDILSFISKKDIWLNVNGLANIINLGIDISIPCMHVLQIYSNTDSIHTGISVFNGPFNIIDSMDNVKICLKWIGSRKTIEDNKYEVESNGLGQINRIRIPKDTVIAQAILIKINPINISYY